jgi:hypothetical protein
MSNTSTILEDELCTPAVLHMDRALATPSSLRFLLSRFDKCFKPRYSVLVPKVLSHDGTDLKKLQDKQKFEVLMACAIAAARESYKAPNWKPLAHICRDWAAELIAPMILTPNEDTLQAILLLLVYELAESTRGATWELLDLAIRTCLQLGLLRAPQTVDLETLSPNSRSFGGPCLHSLNEIRLVAVLRDIEGYVYNALSVCPLVPDLHFLVLFKQSSTGLIC